MSRRAKRVCVCTGTRAEYGILRPLMRRIAKSKVLELQVAAAGMHLAREFGHTVDDIERDGFEVRARVEMLPRDDTPAAMAASVARGIAGFTDAFENLAAEVVVVLGDRTEAFAAAVAGALSGRVVAHVHGGDRAEGGYDDYMRHAVTKMAHVHFAATEGAARRIRRLGERADRIHTVGAPGLDEIKPSRLPGAGVTRRRYGFASRKPLILAVQHSISTHPETAGAEMNETLAALESLSLPTILIRPNSDAGGRAMTAAIEEFGERSWLSVHTSLPRDDFLAVMKAARAMVGNSSAGIIEAAAFHLPVVNVGRRQAGRERSGNTVDVPPDRCKIEAALRKVLYDRAARRRLCAAQNVYGDGRASARIVRVLERIETGGEILTKQITY